MNFQHFKTLMWKNLRLRMYHWTVTMVEIVLPIGFTWLCVNMINSFPSSQGDSYPSPIESLTPPIEFGYAPNIDSVTAFMKNMNQTEKGNITNIVGFPNDGELVKHLFESGKSNLIGVYFRNFDKSYNAPESSFSYVLRQSISVNDFFNPFLAKAQLLMNKYFILQKAFPVNINDVWSAFNELQIQQFPHIKNPFRNDVLVVFYITFFAIIITTMPIIGDILEEKNSGMKELMKIAGVKEWMIWLCWFLYAMSVILIVITFMVYVVFANLFKNIPLTVVWAFILLFCMAHIAFCFTISAIFQKNTIATTAYVFYCIIGVLIKFYDHIINPYAPFIKYLYPLSNCYMGVRAILDIESDGHPFTWTSFIFSSAPLFFILCMLFFNIFLYLFLAYYINCINPGKFGIRKPPLFLIQDFFTKHEDLGPTNIQKKTKNPKCFEPPSSTSKPMLRIVDLHKYFKSFHAVRGVDLNTYEGEITVLLGHNGAGKTVTMNMITGIISPSSGSVYYNDKNVFENMENFRLHVGFCPQENRAFPYLSVMNHLLFFGLLKGLSLRDAAMEASDYLHLIGMDTKKDSKFNNLSGGMKRKLSLIMSMMGKVEILILDEPTSGMDAESRRSLWNILLTLRGTRSMIITTHYMNEADVLGDRIAIMNHGVIVCHGTPLFLKNAYDSGYEVTISKRTNNSDAITKLISNTLPSASVVSDTTQEIVYKLPLTEVHLYPKMFQALESAMESLNIANVGVTATTMEQVFLKTGGAIVYDPKSRKTLPKDAHLGKVVDFPLFSQQIETMMKKKFLFTIRDRANVFTKVILPTIIILYPLYIMAGPQNEEMLPTKPTDLSLSQHPGGGVLYQEVNPSISFEKQMKQYVKDNNGEFIMTDGFDMGKTLLYFAKNNYKKYTSFFVSAIDVNRSSIKLMYSRFIKNSREITIDTFTNVLLKTLTDASKHYTIETTSHPVPFKNATISGNQCLNIGRTIRSGFLWYMVLAVFTTDLMVYFASYVSMERLNGFYHIQMMSCLSPAVYWLGTLLFDFTFLMIIMIVRLILFRIFNRHALFIGFNEDFYAFLLMLMLYCISGLLMIYTLSSFVSSENSANKFFMITNLISSTFILIYKIIYILIYMDGSIDNIGSIWKFILNAMWISTFIVPSLTFYLGFLNWIVNFYVNKQCLYCLEMYKPACEAQLQKQSFWYFTSNGLQKPNISNSFKVEGILTQILLLALHIPIYAIILLLIHSGVLGKIFNWIEKLILGSSYGFTRRDKGDDDVQQEHHEVQKLKDTVARKKEKQKIALLVDRLHKNYFTPHVFTAVNDLSFMVDRGTCFGLLGVNGAGKTTTFRMLTAEIIPTLGDAYINGIKMSENKPEYLSAAGYCSQTNSIIEELTGSEMLMIIASIRGVTPQNANELVNKWLSVVGLDNFKNQRCGTYSGGNKRKLCSLMALIGNPKVVFMDEPTAGVDPVSRRNLYDIMESSKSSGQTVVLTSHDIDECETLCDRLTIMVSGSMKCIGTVQHLKKRYALGFSALIKISNSAKAKQNIPKLKETVGETFGPSKIFLKDEHLDVLYYQISDTSLPWSKMFENMEKIKLQFPDVVEDYVLTDMPLEEVFISFAKGLRPL